MLATVTSLAILALASLPSVSAAKCSVIGWQYDNSIYDPQGAPTIATTQGLHFYRDGKLIHEWTPCNKCSSICVDSKNVEVPGLKTTVGWAATCNINTFKECHGSYDTQTHIDGDKPTAGNDFYGIGITHSAQCRVQFDCE